MAEAYVVLEVENMNLDEWRVRPAAVFLNREDAIRYIMMTSDREGQDLTDDHHAYGDGEVTFAWGHPGGGFLAVEEVDLF